jgi:hypothetical protein
MTLDKKIAELKKAYPTLTKGFNDQTVEMNPDEYETTIGEWAQNLLDQETKKAADEAAKIAAEAKLTALGLTTDDLKALGL